MIAALSPFGLLRWPEALLLLPVAALGGLAFAAFGMVFTGVLPTIEAFNLPVFLVVTPMFLFSGTFFPLEQLPAWAQRIAWTLPLTHLAHLTRTAALASWTPQAAASAAYLVLFAAIAYVGGVRAMVRRLIV
jgi:lipooligosaccharide transport system permease protein